MESLREIGMSILKNMTISARVIVTMALMMTVLGSVLTVLSYINLRDTYVDRSSVQNDVGIQVALQDVALAFDDVDIQHAMSGLAVYPIWNDVPDSVPNEILEHVTEATGLEPTIFRFDQTSQNFLRIATTLLDANGQPSTGTPLARNEAYEALMAGQVFFSPVDVLGTLFMATYQPIFNDTGSVVGAVAVVRDYSDFQSELYSSLVQKVLEALVTLSLMLVAGFFVVRKLMAPFADITGSIVTLSEGSLYGDIPHAERRDEIGAISKSLTVLQSSMQHAEDLQKEDTERRERDVEKQREQQQVVDVLSAGLEKLSNLDLTARIESNAQQPFPQDYDGLRVSFNQLVDELSSSIETIQAVADEVSSDAREMSDSSNDLSSRTEAQAATLQQSAAALEQLSESVQSTAQNASEAEATTTENRAVAKQTGEIVDNAVAAMEAIEASSQQITQIISVIDDIAFQTNLLALNAGVEAARAGEAGRGFAVVASEVRALAQHSSASAQEIKALIAASSEQVENGSKLVRSTGESLGDIISRVDRVAVLVSDIAVSAKEQSVGVSEINSGVRDLDAATQRNAAMAEEASAASEGLTNAADRLASNLARFQMAKASGTANWAAAAAARPVMSIQNTPTTAAPHPITATTPMDRTQMPAPARVANAPQGNAFKDF